MARRRTAHTRCLVAGGARVAAAEKVLWAEVTTHPSQHLAAGQPGLSHLQHCWAAFGGRREGLPQVPRRLVPHPHPLPHLVHRTMCADGPLRPSGQAPPPLQLLGSSRLRHLHLQYDPGGAWMTTQVAARRVAVAANQTHAVVAAVGTAVGGAGVALRCRAVGFRRQRVVAGATLPKQQLRVCLGRETAAAAPLPQHHAPEQPHQGQACSKARKAQLAPPM